MRGTGNRVHEALACVHECRAHRQPVRASRPSLLGTATGPGGKQQVVYNHHPLYHFAGGQGYGPGDKKPGDIGGQGIYKIWYVLSAKGTPIK